MFAAVVPCRCVRGNKGSDVRRNSHRQSIASIDNAVAAVFQVADRVVKIATDDGLLRENAPDFSNRISEQIQADLKKIRYLYKDFTYQFEKECRLVETPESVTEKGIRAEFDYSGTRRTAVVKNILHIRRLS